MVLKTGDLRNYVTIQVGTRTPDGQGGWTTTFADTYYEWMKATPLSVSKVLEQGGIKHRKAVNFVGRINDLYTLTNANKIKWGTETYMIFSVLPDETNEYNLILAYV
jgi:hypothetical protein